MKFIDSPIFGDTTILDEDDDDWEELQELIQKYPVTAFGMVNKRLNTRGFMSTIDIIRE